MITRSRESLFLSNILKADNHKKLFPFIGLFSIIKNALSLWLGLTLAAEPSVPGPHAPAFGGARAHPTTPS